MTIRDIAHYQFNAIRNNYTSNMVTPIHTQQTNTSQVNQPASSTRTDQISRTNSDSLQFLNQYKSSMAGLASAADKIRSLSKNDIWGDLEVSSSDESIVSDATKYGKIPQYAEYDINVTQLAQKQISNMTVSAGATQITIESGTGSEAVKNTFQIDPNITGSEQIMEDIVNQINERADVGVKASIIGEGADAVIQLESSESGKAKSFKVTGMDMSGNNVAEAQNLQYTLNGVSHEQGCNNNIDIDPNGSNKFLRVDFKSVGKVTVTADVDKEKLTKYTEQFVESYNKTIDLLVNNAHRGSGVSNALDRFTQAPISDDAMRLIGLDFGRDGKISLDTEKFQKAMKEDIFMVYDILSDNYSVADSIYQKADRASHTSAASLLDKSKLENNNGGVYIINNYNYFSRSSPFGYSGFPYSDSLFFNARV